MLYSNDIVCRSMLAALNCLSLLARAVPSISCDKRKYLFGRKFPGFYLSAQYWVIYLLIDGLSYQLNYSESGCALPALACLGARL